MFSSVKFLVADAYKLSVKAKACVNKTDSFLINSCHFHTPITYLYCERFLWVNLKISLYKCCTRVNGRRNSFGCMYGHSREALTP